MPDVHGRDDLERDKRHLVAVEEGSLWRDRIEIRLDVPGGGGFKARVSGPVSDYALLMETVSDLVTKNLDQTGLAAKIHVRLLCQPGYPSPAAR